MNKTFLNQLLHDLLITIGLLLLTTGFASVLFFCISKNPANIALFYIIGIITAARYTNGYLCGIAASFLSIIVINYFLSIFQPEFFTSGLSVYIYLYAEPILHHQCCHDPSKTADRNPCIP